MCATRKLCFWVTAVLPCLTAEHVGLAEEVEPEAAGDPWGRSPLHEAAERGHTSLVKKILAGNPAAASLVLTGLNIRLTS